MDGSGLPDGVEAKPTDRATDAATGRRRWAARLVALALGAALVCAAEIGLTLFDYGGPTELFVKLPDIGGTQSYVTNLNAFRATFVSNPVFRASGSFPGIPPQRFAVRKEPGVYRILVVGGSAAAGFPFVRNGTFSLMLQTILNAASGGPRVEVVNAGAAAIGSYSVLERMDEVLGYGTDMVVAYTGHNEFYGAYGSGSSIPLSTWRPAALAQIWLRHRRLSMAAGDLLALVLPAPPEEEVHKALMTLMPRRADIRRGDRTYERTRGSYAANLRDVVRAARRRGVPVVLCTLGANLRDFPPLGSLHPPGFSAADEAAWREHLEAADRLRREGQLLAAAGRLESALALDPGHADTHWRLARCLDAAGRHGPALEHYQAACDLDTVRWRISSDYNEAVRQVAREAAEPGVVLADVEAYLRDHAPDGIPGSGLFLEHVHPTLEGHFRIGECIARAITESAVADELGTWDWSRRPGLEQCIEASDLDEPDRIHVLERGAELLRSLLPPGPLQRELEDDLTRRARELDAAQSPIEREALIATTAARGEEFDFYDRLHLRLAWQYAEMGEHEAALAEVEKVKRYGALQVQNWPYSGLFVREADILLMAGRPRDAVGAAEKALELDPGRSDAVRILERAHAMLANERSAP